MKKEIKIRKSHIKNLLISCLAGFSILFALEHFGEFSFIIPSPTTYSNDGKINMQNFISDDLKASSIYYKSYFDNTVTTGGNGYTASDLKYKSGDFYSYSNKLFYILEAMKLDFVYGILIFLSIFTLTTTFSIFKFKIV